MFFNEFFLNGWTLDIFDMTLNLGIGFIENSKIGLKVSKMEQNNIYILDTYNI